MLSDWLRLTIPEGVVFERPPVVLTVFQVRFSEIPEVTDQEHIEPFRRAVEDTYPSFTPMKQFGMQIDLGGPSEPRRSETIQWRFSDESENWTVVLARDFLTLETRRYEHFQDFLSRLRLLLDALVEHLRPKLGTRLGLRYINEIRVGDESLSSVVRPELLGPLSVPQFEERTAQSIQEVLLRLSEDQFIQVRHGLFPEGNAILPRSGELPSTGPFYLLDFDAYRTFSSPTRFRMETNTIYEYVKRYHDDIERLFLWSLSREFVQDLGVYDLAD